MRLSAYRRDKAASHGASWLARGFTLIELAVVVVIIGILAAIALPNYIKLKDKAKEAEAKAALHNIQLVLERFAVDAEGNYPPYIIGGDNMAMETPRTNRQLLTANYREVPPSQCSDPLLRNGYLASYPRNPFVRDPRPVELMQQRYGDPLRSSSVYGHMRGTRFGPDGTTMGQVLCDPRWLTWDYIDYKDNQTYHIDTFTSVQYDFYDVWQGGLHKPFLSGSFMYKSMGEVTPSPGSDRSRELVKINGKKTLIPMDKSGDATYPISLSTYVLGVWGGFNTKGLDILGEEPLVLFKFEGTQRGGDAATFHYNENTGKWELPARVQDRYELLGIPAWTRGVNRSHIGPLWGSPYGPAGAEGGQLQFGNANGMRDAIILLLTSGDNRAN